MSDAPAVQRLAGAPEIAATTFSIPHPYELAAAEDWIRTHPSAYEAGTLVNFAIVVRDSEDLVGAIGFRIDRAHHRAELGYWIGVDYWGRGYATEAGTAVLHHGFTDLGLNRVFARHMTMNPASGRV